MSLQMGHFCVARGAADASDSPRNHGSFRTETGLTLIRPATVSRDLSRELIAASSGEYAGLVPRRRRAACPGTIPSRRRCHGKVGVCSQVGWAAGRRPRRAPRQRSTRARYFTKVVVVCLAPSGVAASLTDPVTPTAARWPTWPWRALLAYGAEHVPRICSGVRHGLDPDASSRSGACPSRGVFRHPARVPDSARSPGHITGRVLRDSRRRLLPETCPYAAGVPARGSA
jgi:hypothetical protein